MTLRLHVIHSAGTFRMTTVALENGNAHEFLLCSLFQDLLRPVCCLTLFFIVELAKSAFVRRAGRFCQTCFRDWRSSRCVSDCGKSGTQLRVLSCNPKNHELSTVDRESTMGRQPLDHFESIVLGNSGIPSL